MADAEEVLLNKCIAGDIFGLRPFFAKNNYLMSAQAIENTIVYAIPISVFRPYIGQNTAVLDFLLQSFASTIPSNRAGLGSIKDSVNPTDRQSEIQFFQVFDYNKKPLLIQQDAIVQVVAQTMTDNLLDCVIIHENNIPIGVITDVELRIKIATGKFYITTFAKNIMSEVVSVSENISLSEAQLVLLQNNVTHLVVTKDGTDNSEVRGIISQHDLIAAQANNPGVFIKEIKRSITVENLVQIRQKLSEFVRFSIERRIPISHINVIVGDINLAFYRRCIELCFLKLGSAPARFSWFCVGSQGRKEQLLLTDQDNFLVFEDVAANKYQIVKDYFLALANQVNSDMATIGYAISVDGNVARNLDWCKSLSEWNNQFLNWINNPGEKSDARCKIFFDFEIAYGEEKIEQILHKTILENASKNKKFLAFLATDSLKKEPPLNFFKNFAVEESGQFKEKFDLKEKVIAMYTDVARVLALSQGFIGLNNTNSRFKQLAISEPKYAEVYTEAADSFLSICQFKTNEGLKSNSDGRFLNIDKLSKSDREKLKQNFESLNDLEDIVKNKFSLTYFS
jgi:CBS domain-containing protein